jgi:hypothetical protein
MAMSEQRVSGIISLKIDGEQIPAKGSFTWALSGEKKEYDTNADGTGFLTGKAVAGYIKGTLSNIRRLDVDAIRKGEDVTVLINLGNGKAVTAANAVQVDAMEGNSETGEIPVEWRSDTVKEISL